MFTVIKQNDFNMTIINKSKQLQKDELLFSYMLNFTLIRKLALANAKKMQLFYVSANIVLTFLIVCNQFIHLTWVHKTAINSKLLILFLNSKKKKKCIFIPFYDLKQLFLITKFFSFIFEIATFATFNSILKKKYLIM